MAIEKKYQTGLKRIIAVILDGIILLPLVLIGNMLRHDTFQVDFFYYDLWDLCFSFIGILYSIFFHYYYGRTIGKLIVGLKVLDVTESRRLTFYESFKRDLISIILQTLLLAYYFYDQNKGYYDLGTSFFSFSDIVEYSYFIWIFVEVVTMYTNRRRRAIHDFLANSVVVNYK